MQSVYTFRQFIEIQEQMTSSGGEVRGLGFVSGDPGGVLNTWIVNNESDASTRYQVMNLMKKNMHDDFHKQLDIERQNRINRLADIIKDNK